MIAHYAGQSDTWNLFCSYTWDIAGKRILDAGVRPTQRGWVGVKSHRWQSVTGCNALPRTKTTTAEKMIVSTTEDSSAF